MTHLDIGPVCSDGMISPLILDLTNDAVSSSNYPVFGEYRPSTHITITALEDVEADLSGQISIVKWVLLLIDF